MIINQVNVEFVTENAVLLAWPDNIDQRQHQTIMTIQELLTTQLGTTQIDSVASYCSLLVYYHFQAIKHNELIQVIADTLIAVELNATAAFSGSSISVAQDENSTAVPAIEIPVLYDQEAGWDLSSVAMQCNLSVSEVIQLHSQPIYRAYALGFTPGFCYLAAINEALVLARKNTPRTHVPAGAVAIAGNQSAVYPSKSPGGWHILGQTPLPMYQLLPQFKSTLTVGDTVQFRSINKDEFLQLGGNLVLEFK